MSERSFVEVPLEDVEDEALGDRRPIEEVFLRLEFDEALYGSSFLTFDGDGYPRRVDPLEYVHVSTDADARIAAGDGDVEVCDTCGVEKIGGKCLTRRCDDRHSSVDRILGDVDEEDVDENGDSMREREHGENEPRGKRFDGIHELAQNDGSIDPRDGGISHGGVINSTAAELTTRAPSAADVADAFAVPTRVRPDSFVVDVDEPQISTPVLDEVVERIAERRAVRECERCRMLIRPADVEWVDGTAHCPVHGTPIPPARRSE